MRLFITFFFLINISILAQTTPGLLKAIIVLDSNQVAVEENGTNINRLVPEKGWHFSKIIKYDELTGYISLIENKFINEYNWNYKVIVWDYLNNKKYSVLEGESGSGETYHAATVTNYNPERKSCLIAHYGWEWCWVSKYNNGFEEEINGANIYDINSLMAVLNDDEIIIKAAIMGEETEYHIYSWKTKELIRINEDVLINHNNSILKTSGENSLYLNKSPFADEIHCQDIMWSPYHNALAFTTYNDGYCDLFFYDVSKSTDLKLKSGHINYAVIWETKTD